MQHLRTGLALSLSIISITALAPAQKGSFGKFGKGCRGAHGVPYIDYSGRPLLSQVVSVHLRDAEAYSPGLLAFGNSNTSVAGIKLPFHFSKNCALLVSAEAVVPIYTDAYRHHEHKVRIPSGAAWIGRPIYNQACIKDKANPTGHSWSRGGIIVVGDPVVRTPTNLRVASVRKASVDLQWNDISNNEASFQIYAALSSGTLRYVGSAPANATSFTVPNLTPCRAHKFAVYAKNKYSISGRSNVTVATPMPRTPNAPSDLHVARILGHTVNLQWNENSGEELGFELFHSFDGRRFVPRLTTGRDRNTVATTLRNPNVTHWFSVRTKRSCGVFSGFSSTLIVPAAPSRLRAVAVRKVEVDLAWKDNAIDESGYRVAISTNGSTWDNLAKPGANKASYTVKKLRRGTTYYFKVRCRNGHSYSPYSNVIKVRTKS